MIALNNPIKPNLKKLTALLDKVHESGWYTNFGPLHNELTDKLEDYLGVKNLLLTNNGTSALQVAGRALGSDSILSTPFSFVATASAYLWQKDELAFADIDPQSLNLSPNAVKTAFMNGCKADTILATHVYGNPCDVFALDQLGQKYNCHVIYDAAHAFGVDVEKQSVLNYGSASTLSFHATKIFHTVEGGAIVFKDRQNFEKAKEIINFGIKYGNGVACVGINAKLNEYQAAVGLVNLDEIDNILEHRAELFYQYRKGLDSLVELPEWHPQSNVNGAYMPILLKNDKQLKIVSSKLAESGIQSRHYFSPSLDNIFADSRNYGTKNSIKASERVLCLPLHASLKIEDVENVISKVKDII